MAEIVASALLQVIFEKLATEALKKVVRSKGIVSELENLERTLSHIQSLLNDASQKEITNESVKSWLDRLQHLAYEIDDILDGLATDAMHREFTKGSGSVTGQKVKKLMPTTIYTNFTQNNLLREKIERITTNLQNLEKEKNHIGLIVNNDRPNNVYRKLQTTSLVDVPSIVGRQGEKESLVRTLLGGEPSEQNFSVVPIVGMGGVGKTTLAGLLYDDEQVNNHFEHKAWVCVSSDFDIFAISKVIFESVSVENKDFADLNLLQIAIRDKLREKRFLLVLDDVWSECYSDWKTLVGPFHTCATGSKIIMTTRKEQLVKMVCYGNINHLEILSHDDALCLFLQNALGVNNFDSYLELKPYGEGIVKKCDGLPLALIALGRLLRTIKTEEEYWIKVLNSEIWMLKDGGDILPALRLSYHDLSSHLKRLFAYCSLFPKGCVFDKEQLVLLWMAEGFLHQSSPSKSTTEQLGREYFDELLSRSFFQHAPNSKLFVMHDLLNDLATSVGKDFFKRLLGIEMDNDIKKETLAKYHHMSFVRKRYQPYKKFESFKRAESSRTFLATSAGVLESWNIFYLSNKILADLLPKLPLLRVLCLSFCMIDEVPDSIGNLKHLRYLNLSQTNITSLFENVGNLYNLQTLILFGCKKLTNLPKSFVRLKNLRHFDIRDTPLLNKMPSGISELKSLQTLSKIIIGKRFELTELKGLKNLCGKVSIKRLDKVKDSIHGREADFSQKRLSELELEWSDVFDGRNETLEKEVLHELNPSNDSLKQLKIVSFGGIEFPDWVGDCSFLQLTHVSLLGCKKCISLPPVGQLPSLKELFIEGLDGVKIVGMELGGSGVAFRSLEILNFKDMKGWKEWSINNSGDVFPCLKKLYMEDCPNLDVISLEVVPSLKVLEIRACGNGVLRSLVQVASSVIELKIESISRLTNDVWGVVIEYLGKVEELCISKCNEIRYIWESQSIASKNLVNLRKLTVSSCDNLVRLGEKEEEDNRLMMTSLRMLRIDGCKSMECCTCPNSSIVTLKIYNCDSMTGISFPRGGGGGQNLKTLLISGCKLLEKEFGGGPNSLVINSTRTPMLEVLWISEWVNLKSIIDLNCYRHLNKLTISQCSSLESFPAHQLPNLTSLKQLVITNCPSMDDSFPSSSGQVWPPNLHSLVIGGLKKPMTKWGPPNFPTSLVTLILYGGLSEDDDVIDFSNLSHLFPSSLMSLVINKFKKLERVSMGLQHLTSLHDLRFWTCPKVMDLPEMLLPSLLSLTIIKCPKLKEMCSRSKTERGSYSRKISHIPRIILSDGS